MKIQDFMQEIYAAADSDETHYVRTCDQLKIGNPEEEIRKIAVSMFATAGVIREAAAWGANLLIVHEPTFYFHWDKPAELDATPAYLHELIEAKRAFIRKHGLTVYRYHDHPHHRVPDLISEGQTRVWGLSGSWRKGKYWGVNNFELDEPTPVLEVARLLSKNWGIAHLRIAGSRETLVRSISLCFGTPGHVQEELRENDLVLTGEICEWSEGEFARDLSEILGEKKTLMVLGHIPSERQGMRLLTQRLESQYPEIPVRYFECGEVYGYLD